MHYVVVSNIHSTSKFSGQFRICGGFFVIYYRSDPCKMLCRKLDSYIPLRSDILIQIEHEDSYGEVMNFWGPRKTYAAALMTRPATIRHRGMFCRRLCMVSENTVLLIIILCPFWVASFPGPAQLSVTCSMSLAVCHLQYCKRQKAGWGQSWAGPGNEATFWVDIHLLL